MSAKRNRRSSGGGQSSLEDVLDVLFGEMKTLHALRISSLLLLGAAFCASFVLWIYFMSRKGALGGKLLLVEGIVFGVLLLANLYRIFFVGYNDGVGRNFSMVYIPASILSVIGFLIRGVNFLGTADPSQQTILYKVVNFFAVVIGAMVMALLPSLLLMSLIWLIVHTVEFFRR